VTRRNVGSDGPIDSIRLLPFDSVSLAVGAQTLAFTDNGGYDWMDIQWGYPNWFVFGMGWSGRFEPMHLSTTRGARCGSAVKTVRFAAFYTSPASSGRRGLAVSQPIRIQDAC